MPNCNVTWTTLPAQLTLVYTNSSGCTSTTTKTIVSATTCEVMAGEYISFTQAGHVLSNIQYLNSYNGPTIYGVGVSIDFGDGTGLQTTPTHTYAANGTYTIHISYSAKQCSFNYYKTVTITSSRMSDREIETPDDIIVYPNPTSSIVNIDLKLQNNAKTTVAIRTIEGKLLISKDWDLLKGKQNIGFTLPSNIAKGTYLIEINNPDIKTVKRLIVE